MMLNKKKNNLRCLVLFAVVVCLVQLGMVKSSSYIAVNTELSWTSANTYCESNFGTSLATITSASDNRDALNAVLLTESTNAHWIGHRYYDDSNSTTGPYQWADGTSYTNYTSWDGDSNEPSSIYEDCTEIRSHEGHEGLWNDFTCTNERYFLCNAPYYLNFTHGEFSDYTHNEAQEYCQTEYGTSLATVSSEDGNSWIYDDLDEYVTDYVPAWIGLSDTNNEGEFVWLDGRSPTTYTNWNDGEPNDSGGVEDCTWLQRTASGGGGEWNDANCDTTVNRFYCNAHEYIGVRKNYTFSEANDYCNDTYNSSLATITSQIENNRANKMAKIMGLGNLNVLELGARELGVWIGLYGNGGEGEEWFDGTTTSHYSNWISGEPLVSTSLSYCGEFAWNGTNGTWNYETLLQCASKQQYFICNAYQYGPSTITRAPTPSPTGSATSPAPLGPSVEPTEVPTPQPSVEPTDVPTPQPTGSTPSPLGPSVDPTEMPTLPTQSPYYECDIGEDGLIVSWDDLFSGGDDNEVVTSASISTEQGVNSESGAFEVTVSVTGKYVIGSSYDVYSGYYEHVTNEGYLGVTYVLDTNEFENEGRLLEDANSCENRESGSFDGMSFVNDFWNYTLYPSDNSELGNNEYGLEYGDQNIWSLSLIGNVSDDCDEIEWTHTFSFEDLWSVCKDSDNFPSYDLTDDDANNEIRLDIDFYLTLVSPNPLYLELCDGGDSDCGQYLTYTLASHPLTIVFTKQQSLVSNSDGIMIDLFTNTIISTAFVEDSDDNEYGSAYFQMTMITSVPNFMSLNSDTAVILSPSVSDLLKNNNNISFTDATSMIINEDSGSYMTSDCLIATSYRCLQKFDIIILISECPSESGIILDGNYYFSADFECRDGVISGYGNDSESICNDYLSDEPLSITLDSVDLSYTESCDSSVYEIDWSGEITFWNEYYNVSESSFAFGDTVYVKVSIDDDISNYDVFDLSLSQCYVCTADVNDSGNLGEDGCLDSSIVDTSLFYMIEQDSDLDYQLLEDSGDANNEYFTFTLPVLADDVFFVHCIAELDISLTNTRRRNRNLLQSSETDGNTYESAVGKGRVEGFNQDIDTSDDNSDDNSSSKSNNSNSATETTFDIIIVIGSIIIVALIIFIVYLLYQRKQSFGIKNIQTSVEFMKKSSYSRTKDTELEAEGDTTEP